MNDLEHRLAETLNSDIQAELGPRRPAPAFRPTSAAPASRGRRLAPFAAAAAIVAVATGSVVFAASSSDDGHPQTGGHRTTAPTSTPPPAAKTYPLSARSSFAGKDLAVIADPAGNCPRGNFTLAVGDDPKRLLTYVGDGPSASYLTFTLPAKGFGDINGDGAADAVVVGGCVGPRSGGDSGTTGVVITQTGPRQLKVLGYFAVGQRDVAVRFQGRDLITDIPDLPTDTPRRYHWTGTALVER